MKALITYLFTGFIVFPAMLSAQSVANYTPSRSTDIIYNSVMSNGQSFASWRSTGDFSEDDNRSEFTDIGFDFWYNGTRYTQFSISTNGYIDFSTSTDDGGPQCDDYGYCNGQFTASTIATGTWNTLAPFYDDMTTRAGIDPLGTSMHFLLTGTAPSRVLTIEWDAMAVYQNITPDLNFQVKLYETTGIIEYVYETMNAGTHVFSYTVGMNASTVSGIPAANELLTQQTENTATFNNTVQNNLTTMPTNNSQLTFTPLTPANPMGNLTFTATTSTGMTLNWADWAANEVGYAIYSSTDDVNYFFNTQTTASATSALISGLLPGTTYYWKVYAVTEGALSTALSGNNTTLPPALVTSVQTGRWDKAATWDCACIPSAGDNVLIQDGHRVTLRSVNATCNDLTIGQGASGELRIGRSNNASTYDLTINGNTLINTQAIFQVNTGSNTTHTLNIRGNVTNNGTFNMQTDNNSFALVDFIKTDGDQVVSGSGATTNFYTINLNKSIKSNVLSITSTDFSCDPDALTIISGGTFEFSSAGVHAFSLYNTLRDIPLNGKIIMNSSSSTMSFGAGINLRGDLTINSGTVNIGDANDENIISFGGMLEVNGGALNIAGRYDRNDSEETLNCTITGGTFTMPTVGSTSITRPPFGIDVSGSTFNMLGGTIIIERAGGANLGYTNTGTTFSSVTGGTLQIGNATTPLNQTIEINSSEQIGNLLLNSANATAQLVTNDLTVVNDVALTLGVLDPNAQNITLGGDWLVSGGSHSMTTGLVTFIGSAQSITSNGSTFNDIILSGTDTKTFQDNLLANGDLTINTIMGINTGFAASISGDWVNNGTFTRDLETITFNGSTDQQISGTSSTDFTNITINKAGGRVLIESTVNLAQAMDIQTATEFDADGIANNKIFSLLSSLNEESRIGTLPAGASVTGDLRAEKYIPVDGTKRWRFISSIVEGAAVTDLQNEIPISGSFIGSDNGTGTIPIGATGSLAYYDNTIGDPMQTLDDRWVLYPVATNIELLTSVGSVGRGFTIWIRDLGAVTFDLTGTLNQGTIDYTPTGTHERWNLIANPYPSAVDWDAASGWTKSGIQGNAIHVWNGLQYLTWNGAVGGLGSGVIPKGTSYFIEGNAPSMTLISTESVKTTTRGTTHRSDKTETPSFLALTITDKTYIDQVYMDQTYIQFVEGASASLDAMDAGKLSNAIFNFSTTSEDGKDLSINALGKATCSLDVSLNLADFWEATYEMTWDNLKSIPATTILLTDAYTNQTIDLRDEVKFSFQVTNDEASYGKNRFSISFNSIAIDTELSTIGTSPCNDENATVGLESSQPDIEYHITQNNETAFTAIGNGDDLFFDISKDSLVIGLNTFEVSAINTFCQQQKALAPISFYHIVVPEVVYDKGAGTLTTSVQEELQWYKNDLPFGEKGVSSITLDPESAIYYVTVTNEGCSLTSTSFTYVAIDNALMTVGIQPCGSDYANIGIKNTQPGIAYIITQKEEAIFSTIGTGEDIFFKLPIESLDNGLNTFEVRAINDIQQEKNLTPISFTYIFTPNILYDSETGTLTTHPQDGLQWYKGDLPIGEIGSESIVVNQEESAVYSVSVINEDCILTSESLSIQSAGLEPQGISVSPNPMQEQLNIYLTGNDNMTTAQIINSYGKVVISQIDISNEQSKVDTKGLTAGVYFLKLAGEDQTQTIKLVKQ